MGYVVFRIGPNSNSNLIPDSELVGLGDSIYTGGG
ncbi:hypothetical protein COLO4_07434 [Corchorus olitorius]|uniref:Uncharacterized protein n=1 Tax=Corchorus olitorius TaxID=93759 RepID=A0A1R3KJS0_9ROSI|nr:hypothetical protein COLO4_07434 [Corchorus olitorius]